MHFGRYPVNVRRLGLVDYQTTWHAMREFTQGRQAETSDEIWLLEHPRTYTVGIQAKAEHFPKDSHISLVHTDRGGQITYHGPGQVVLYLLLDLKRYRSHNRALSVKNLINTLEEAVLQLLHDFAIDGTRRDHAPGVYVNDAKIASLGLRIKNGCCYHGVALNVDMDLSPFQHINPCGYPGLAVTQLRDLGVAVPVQEVAERLLSKLLAVLPFPGRLG